MSSSEDKCAVSEDKHEDRGKMKYFREAINSTEGKKGKEQTASRRVYKNVEIEDAEGGNFSTQSET